jgi:hypothetical protein
LLSHHKATPRNLHNTTVKKGLPCHRTAVLEDEFAVIKGQQQQPTAAKPAKNPWSSHFLSSLTLAIFLKPTKGPSLNFSNQKTLGIFSSKKLLQHCSKNFDSPCPCFAFSLFFSKLSNDINPAICLSLFLSKPTKT